jgi:hypothetical protein
MEKQGTINNLVLCPRNSPLPAVLIDIDLVFSVGEFSDAHCSLHFESLT